MKDLAKKIRDFLDVYAGIKPDWIEGDDIDDKYTSPDAYEFFMCANQLEQGIIPARCWSDWGSGGYQPYTDKKGCMIHDELIKEILSLSK